MTPAPLEEHKFIKLVKDNGYQIRPTSKHYEIINNEGKHLMTFAVSHKKGGKREVKYTYIKDFMNLIDEVKDND